MGTPRKLMGCCYLSIRINSNAPAANCVSQLVFFQCYQTLRFTISLCRLTGKNNTPKIDTVLFLPLHPQLNPAVWAEKNSGWYKLPNYKQFKDNQWFWQSCSSKIMSRTEHIHMGWSIVENRQGQINAPLPPPPSHTAHWVGGTVDLLIGRHTRCTGAAPWETRKLT